MKLIFWFRRNSLLSHNFSHCMGSPKALYR